jgi:hypothetical protein
VIGVVASNVHGNESNSHRDPERTLRPELTPPNSAALVGRRRVRFGRPFCRACHKVARLSLTHRVASPASIDALRKVHSPWRSLSACSSVVDIIRYLLKNLRQFEKLVFYLGIFGFFCEFAIFARLFSQIIRVVLHTKISSSNRPKLKRSPRGGLLYVRL